MSLNLLRVIRVLFNPSVLTLSAYKTSSRYDLRACGLGGLVHQTSMRDIVGSNPARVETIFRPLVCLAGTRRALG